MPKNAPPYADRVDTEPNHRHLAFADWLTETTGYEVDVKSVQLAASLTNEFRGTDADLGAKDAAKRATADRRKERRLASLDRFNARVEKLRAEQARVEAEMAEARAAIERGEPMRAVPVKAVPVKAAPAKQAAKKAPVRPPAKEKAASNVTSISGGKKAPAKKATRRGRPAPSVVADEAEDLDEF